MPSCQSVAAHILVVAWRCHLACPLLPPGAAVLDSYFKSYFWSFKLLILALAAIILAQTTNAFIGQSLAVPAADIAAPRALSRTARTAGRRDLTSEWEAFLERNVFKAAREDLTPVVEETAEPAAADTPLNPEDFNENNCQKSALSTSLVTTMVTPDPAESVAVFQDPGEKDIIVYRVGDQVQGQAEVLFIERRNVFVKNNNRCERFSIDEASNKPRVASNPVPQRAARGKDGGLGDGVTKVSDGEYTIPKADIDNVLSNLNKIATQARIVPSFRNGKANGFKLFSIRPNSLYAKIGIQNGDIIQKINGYEINSPDKALAIYSKLKDATNITVDLLRRGKKKSLSYNIR